MDAWHFLEDSGKLRYGRRTTVVVGKTLSIKRRPVLCALGFHASERALDGLHYAPGALVCRVRLGGEIVVGTDKVAAQQRTVVWMADATRTLHEFACWAATWVLDRLEARGATIDPRSRDAVAVKLRWLDGLATDKELAAARAAARAAAGAAAGAAAWDAAWAAARAAAGAAAWDAAGAAAWDVLNARLEEMFLALAPAVAPERGAEETSQ